MNLAVLKKSRRAPHVGDIFAMRPPDGRFLFGRVISTDANPLGVGGAILIYVYAARSDDKLPVPRDLSPSKLLLPRDLSPSKLLLPPLMTNKLPWSKGYFEVVESRPLGPGERLAQHCFVKPMGPTIYYDETGARLSGPVEPIGEFGLDSYQTIDDAVCRALGIPVAPDE
jgi:hypothetical protein